MELKDLLTLYRRWIWLLIGCLVLGLASGYAASRIQEPIYESSAKVLITRTRQPGSTDILSINDQQLVLTYLHLLKTRPVLDKVRSRLGIDINKDDVKVDLITDTQILQIKVQDSDPYQAAAIANELIQVLIEENETLQAGRYTAYEQGLNSQIAQVQEQIHTLQSQITEFNQASIEEQLGLVEQQISDIQKQISTLEQEIVAFPSILSTANRAKLSEKQSQVDQLRSLLNIYQQIQTNLIFIGQPTQGIGLNDPRVTSLQATLSLYQELYLDLLNNLEVVKLARVQSTPTVTEIEEAIIPEIPIRPIPLLYISLSGMVGLFIAAGAVHLIDYLDDTLKSSRKIREMLGLPVLAEIVEMEKLDQKEIVHPTKKSKSLFFNSFGILRINVNRLLVKNPKNSILVTSGALGEGKTTIAINLAASYTQAGKKVILMDADFYKPTLHSRLKLDNRRGLSDVLTKNIDWRETAKECDGVIVITSGHDPEASVVQLESDAMTQLLKQLKKEADIVVIDGPPLLIVDSQVLASQVGGVLLVVREGNTSAAAVRTTLDQLKLMEINVLGVVLNRTHRSEIHYYKRNGYFPNGHHDETEEEVKDQEN